MEGVVWVPTVFTKNRERLVMHEAAIEFFNQIVEQAYSQDLLSGEDFSVDGTLIQAWAGHKSFVRKVDQLLVLNMTAYNHVCMRDLGEMPLQGEN